jgi:two-component system cell cycle response regulator
MHPLRRFNQMLVQPQPMFLLASHEPALLTDAERVISGLGARSAIVLTGEAALAEIRVLHSLSLVLIDVNLPGMEIGQLLAAARDDAGKPQFPIVVISDSFGQEWLDRIESGAVDDVIPKAAESPYWRLRIDMALRGFQRQRELEQLREAAMQNAQTDPLTGIYNRTALLSMLFRETDRVQRMGSSLGMILFDIDDFGHWNSRLGAIACDDLLLQVVTRVGRLLRSYDLFGRVGEDEFLLALPGCSAVNAVLLAERIREEVFAAPFHVSGTAVRMSACFGVAPSQGRSPVVVLRDAEQSLQEAKGTGPESIRSAGDSPQKDAPPVAFLSPTSGDDLLAW